MGGLTRPADWWEAPRPAYMRVLTPTTRSLLACSECGVTATSQGLVVAAAGMGGVGSGKCRRCVSPSSVHSAAAPLSLQQARCAAGGRGAGVQAEAGRGGGSHQRRRAGDADAAVHHALPEQARTSARTGLSPPRAHLRSPYVCRQRVDAARPLLPCRAPPAGAVQVK